MPLFDGNPTKPSVTPGTPSSPIPASQKHILKIVWYVVLGITVTGALGEASHGDVSGFWLVALFGLPTLWLFKGLETRVKTIVTGVFGFVFICFAIFSITPIGKAANASFNNQEAHNAQVAAQKKQKEKAEDAKRQAQEDKDAAEQKALKDKKQAKQDAEQTKSVERNNASVEETATPIISASGTPNAGQEINAEREIKILMKDQFGDTLRYVNVDSREDGGYTVSVGFDVGNILPDGLAKASIEDNMKRAYKDLYTSNIDVHYASMSAYGTTQDKFGNESNSNIYGTNMMRDVGRQINWGNYSSLDFNDLWTVEIINPSFQQQ